MIFLGILDALLWITQGLANLVLGEIPASITNILAYFFQVMDSGFSFVFTVLVDKEIVVSIVTWVMATTAALFGLDITWKIVNLIKLSHKHQEEG